MADQRNFLVASLIFFIAYSASNCFSVYTTVVLHSTDSNSHPLRTVNVVAREHVEFSIIYLAG